MGLRWCCGHRVTDALHRFPINKTKPKWLQIWLCKTFTSLLQKKSWVKSPNVQLTVTKCRIKWKTIMFLCLVSCFLLWKLTRLIKITGNIESLMVSNKKEIISILSSSQHSCLRRDLISFRDNNFSKENRSLHMGLLSLSMCAILRVERKHSHFLLLVDGPGDAVV